MRGKAATRAPGALDRIAALLAEAGGLSLVLPLWVWWAVWRGGFPPAVFLPAVIYLGLAVAVLHLFLPRPRLAGPAAWALGLLAALTAWSLASLLWANDKGAAEIATARQVLMLAYFAIPLLWPPSRRALLPAVAALPLVALAGGVTALAAIAADAGRLLDGRLVEPTGYVNASAALMAMGVAPALVLASRRRLAAPLRVAMLTAAGPLLGILLLGQSRGAVAALVVTLGLALLCVPGRLRLLVPLAIVAAAVGAVLDPLLAVRTVAVEGGDLPDAIASAVRALVLMAAGLAAVAGVYVLADSRLQVEATTTRRASRLIGAVAGIAVLGAAAAALAFGPAPGGWVSARIEDFKTPDYSRLESESSRFGGDLGSNRYDYWRVSVDVFSDHPLGGAGAGNFIAPYLLRRHAEKSTFYSHSLWLGALAQLGLTGFFLLAGFIASLVLALLRAARSGGRWLVSAAALPLAYVLIHAGADWIDAFPVVAGPPLALAGAAARLGDGGAPRAAERARSASLWLALALVAAATVSLPLFVASRLADRGAATWAERPAAAIADLEEAARLDPLAAAPYVRLGIVAVDLDRPALERRAFRRAMVRDPSAWYPEFQLGLLAAAGGRRGAAVSHLRVAKRRDPHEPEVERALRAVREGRAPDARAAQERILASPER